MTRIFVCATWSALALSLCVAGCAQLREELQRAETAYDQTHYDEALVWLTDLENDTPDMDMSQRARFYYLRGMSAYRLGKRNDALHFLALAREVSGDNAEGLRPEWKDTMDRTLTELTPTSATSRARGQAAPSATP